MPQSLLTTSISRGAFRYTLSFLILILGVSCSTFWIQEPVINETFNKDIQGWLVKGNGPDSLPKFSALYGNPDGCITVVDKIPGFWFFAVPLCLVKRFANCYGRVLSYDLKQSAIDSQVDAPDIVLQSAMMRLTLDTGYHPATHWTSYVVNLDERSPWKNNKKRLATRAEIQQVLANIQQVWIRGEFRAGPDQGSLDNVVVK